MQYDRSAGKTSHHSRSNPSLTPYPIGHTLIIEVLLLATGSIVPKRFITILAIFLLLVLFSVSSVSQPGLNRGGFLLLASYTDPNNNVTVSVKLSHPKESSFFLEATFIPPSGYHLYSKDLPRTGINGQGRPTLLELPSNSRMKSIGALTENVASDMVGYEPDGPLVYPEGPVTLTLPIKLPLTSGWVNDQISLTYMACTALSCKVPTMAKLIPVRVPGVLSVVP